MNSADSNIDHPPVVLLLFELAAPPDRDGDYALIRPENWFLPFDTTRDPQRGFRR